MSQTIQNIAPALAHLFLEENQDFKPYYPERVDNHIIFQALSTTQKRRFATLKFGRQHFMRAEVKNGKVHLIFVDDSVFTFAWHISWLKELNLKYWDMIFPCEFICDVYETDYFLVDQNGNLTKIDAYNIGISTYTFYFPLIDHPSLDMFLVVKFKDSHKANLLIRFNLDNCKTKTAHHEQWKKNFDKEYHEYYSIYREDLKNRIRECSGRYCNVLISLYDDYKLFLGEPVKITLTQKLLPYYYKIEEYIKSDEDFVEFLRKAIVEHPSFNALSEEIYWHFESNYPPHMFDAATFKMAKLATEIASQFFDKTPESDSQNIYEQIKELHKCMKNIK